MPAGAAGLLLGPGLSVADMSAPTVHVPRREESCPAIAAPGAIEELPSLP